MDRQLLERMIGAAVLIVALVVIAPAVLDGPGDQEPTLPAPGALDRDVRTVTIRPDRQAAEPPVAVPSPATAQPEPASPVPKPLPQPAPEAKPKSSDETAAPAVAKVQPAPPPAKPKPKVKPKPAPTPKPAVVRSGWAVQLGSFASRDNARRLAGEVSAKGYETYLLPLERDGRTLYRVRVGPRPSREAAEKLAGELAKAGYKGQVAPEGQAS